MAKKSSTNNYAPRTRLTIPSATSQVFRARPAVTHLSTFADLPNADRRRFNPTHTISGPVAKTKAATRLKIPKQKSLSHKLVFAVPKHVKLCVQRKTRRQVLLATIIKRRGGKALGKSRKHRNHWSFVKC